MKRLLLAVLLALLGYFGLRAYRAATFSTPLSRALEREVERQGIKADLERRMHGMDPGQAATEAALLSQRGVARLSTADLMERARLMLELDHNSNTAICAGRFRGGLTPEQTRGYFEGVDSAKMAAWARLATTALKAELRASTPAPRLNNDQTQAMFRTIYETMPLGDQQRWFDIIRNSNSASDADMCWASMAMTTTALQLPDPPRSGVFHAMAQLEGGAQ